MTENAPEPPGTLDADGEVDAIRELPLHERFLRTGNGRRQDEKTVINALETAEILDAQLVPWGSNYTFAVALQHDDPEPFIGIYKPVQGEAPLWDFPMDTLYLREYAAYLLSRVLGWWFVPPTVIREGPHGIGTVQLYIEPEQGSDRWTDFSEFRAELERMALFDIVTNNADRKASHFFLGRFQRQIWGIDHGLTFNVDHKLRTVIWDFADEPIAPENCRKLARLERHQERLFSLLEPYLENDEILMMLIRAEHLMRAGRMPALRSRRSIPYGW